MLKAISKITTNQINKALEAINEFKEGERSKRHALRVLGSVYVELMELHPFTDANGRVIQSFLLACMMNLNSDEADYDAQLENIEQAGYFAKGHIGKLRLIFKENRFAFYNILRFLIPLKIKQVAADVPQILTSTKIHQES